MPDRLKELNEWASVLSPLNLEELVETAKLMAKTVKNEERDKQQPTTHTITNHYGANRGSEFERAYI